MTISTYKPYSGPPRLSRTMSSASISSDTTTSSSASTSRRTRKRFTEPQLAMLERLFRRTSHPSREERETLARETGMDTKHVTIWFQNKRQMERKVALNNNDQSHKNRSSTKSHHALPLLPSPHLPSPTEIRTTRPSLDRIASRSELRAPGTPKRQHNPQASPWDNMPSSPLGPPDSPEPVREKAYVEFGKQRVKAKERRSLEWACAAARVEQDVRRDDDMDLDDLLEGDETEEEDVHEAVTPNSSFGHGVGDVPNKLLSLKSATLEDEDLMAAYVLCGLGRRS